MTNTVTINGETRSLDETNLSNLLKTNGVEENKGGVAIALNGEVVPRSEWEKITIKHMDKIEIVQIVRGG